MLSERRPDLVVVQGAPERLRDHLSESWVWEIYPHWAIFPMLSLLWRGTVL